MNRKKYRLAAAAVSTLAIAFLGTGAPSAFATDADPAVVNGTLQTNLSNPALINPNADVQLEIHKHIGLPVGGYDDGSVNTSILLPKLQGVEFGVYKVGNVDLTTNAGQVAATALYNHTITAMEISVGKITLNSVDYPLTFVQEVTTQADGTATFLNTADGAVGLYVVVESVEAMDPILQWSGSPATSTPVQAASITGAAPFFVTLPMTNPDDRTQWMYDVDVYPKNQSDTVAKFVDDKGTVTDPNASTPPGLRQVDYTIKSDITDGTAPLGMYVVYDDLDPALTFTGASVCLSTDVAPACSLTAGDDYLVYTAPDLTTKATPWATPYTPLSNGPLVTIVFTDTGLTKLQAARTAQVVTVINTTVGAQDEDGVLPNTASVIPNQMWWDLNGIPTVNPETPQDTPPTGTTVPGTSSGTTKTYYGNIQITKYDPNNATTNFEGTEFKVYTDTTPGDGVCSSTDVVAANLLNTTTVDANNKATFTGLQASNYYNDAIIPSQFASDGTTLLNNTTATDLRTVQSYCLVESKAIATYALNPQPFYATINYSTAGATPALATLSIANEKANLGNNLPLTGGEGVAALSLGGLALIGGGLGYYAYTSRKRRTA